ncbi:hypothetical protein P8452_19265 [Trifolium repens]|nr:hypothetical protein P8452_19265 [Trifolium repens]
MRCLCRRLETILIVVTNKKEIVSLPSTTLVQHEGSDCVLSSKSAQASPLHINSSVVLKCKGRRIGGKSR